MNKIFVWFLALAAIVCGSGSLYARETGVEQKAQEPRAGVIRVKLQPEAARLVGSSPRMKAKGKLDVGTTPLSRAAEQVKAVSIRPMLPYSEKFAAQRAKYGLDRWYVVEFDESVKSEKARKIFEAVSGVEKSEAIVPMSLMEGNGNFVTTTRPPMKATAADYMFNDPQLPAQWHYNNYGTIPGTVAGADINLAEAWKVTTGNPEVIVAIIDGGVDYRHEDLAQNMYVNEAELNGTPGVDDDGNGYVDDIYGYNFCTMSAEIYPHTHGTHVAGTVAAVNNNGIGVAGVAGGNGSKDSGIRMLSCQVFDSRSGTAEGDFASAIVYAAEMGATIAQCSWGWGSPGYCEQAVVDAIDYFTANASSPYMTGGLCIFATGNNGETGDYWPGCYEKVLSVAAMTDDLTPASYSNYGEWVDIIAPGGLLDYGEAHGVLSTLPNNSYGYNEGTSMATPHVSGIAALILSKYGSRTFVNESLRTQLLTSVNDFYSYGNNSRFEGKYGVGYIDAGKALVMGDGTAPSPVTDYTISAAQDYMVLDWTIPASADGNVHHHIIYYSTEPFTAESDLSKLSTSVADTKFLNSGTPFTHEVTGLQPMTTYYVAIAAVNRWGAASELSPVKSVTTNAGPEMTVDATSLSMSSTKDSPKASTSFNIGNNADGLLRWTGGKRTVSVRTSSAARPMLSNVRPYSGSLGATKVKANNSISGDYETGDYPKDFNYGKDPWAYIGDTDRSLPNSMAQWFRVDASTYPDGFNLTHIVVDGAYGEKPVIQIFKGDASISSATLLKDVKYSFFAFNYAVQLDEQLFFEPGESFWIVVHFDGGQSGYPLSMHKADADGYAPYSFMSNDKGQSWTQLSVALRGSMYEPMAEQMTWGITARSANPDWSQVLELNPASGTVRKGETQAVTVSADGSQLINGTYNLKVLLNTNETEASQKAIPLTYTVSGNEPDVVTPKIVNFGSLLVGESKTLSVELFNRGYGSFRGSQWGAGLYSDNISSSSENFEGPDYLQSGFPARTRVSVDLTYAPKTSGSHSGYVKFTDADGREVRVLVQGVATEPAKLAIEPATIDAGTLTVGDEPTKVSFKVSNEGKYPLEFVFPRFSDESIDGQTAANHKFGYTVSSNLEGYTPFEYDGNPALIGATDVSGQFNDNVYVTEPVSLGFTFPYYGNNYDKVYITSYGGVMFALSDVNFWPPLTPGANGVRGTGLISAYGSQMMMGPNSRVEYAKSDGKFIVKFVNVLATVYDQEYMPVSYHLTLSGNGDIEIFYDDYEAAALFQSGSTLFCGINDIDCADCVVITSAEMSDYWGNEEVTPDNSRFRYIGSGTAVKFSAPKASFVSGLSVPYGMVSPGESVEITATLAAAADMNAGATFNNIAIVTNDPAPAHSFVRFDAVIAGEGLVPVAELEKTDIDLGDVFRTSVLRTPVTLKNTGHDALEVTAIAVKNGLMSTEIEVPFTLEAGMAKDIVVTVPTDKEGAVADVITVTTGAGTVEASVKANIIGCPTADLSLEEVTETVAAYAPLTKDLTVTNNGNETLLYSLTPNPMISFSLPANADASTSYSYTSSLDDSSVKYEWENIETNGLGEQYTMSYYLLHDYVAVDLPFDFPFYGEKYSKMYIYNSGFISFTERRDDHIWPEPPGDFPEGSIYTNIIAPYWSLHTMDQTKTAGTFHYVTDDRAVVSFIEYGNSMNYGVCFQVILEKDGTFKFQYKGANDNAIIFGLFGLGGICDLGGQNFIRLPERMMTFNQAINFSPVVEAPLAPGKSETVGLSFNTRHMAGNYTGSLQVNTNVPGSEKIAIPLDINLTGEAKPVWPADVTVEHVIGYRSTDYSNPLVQMGVCYDAPFSVANEGTAEFIIADIEVAGPTVYDEWFNMYYPVFNLFVNGPELDWITGEPTGNKQWGMYERGFFTYNIGNEPLEFSIPMVECEQWMTPGTYDIPVTFRYATSQEDLMEGNLAEKTINVQFVVTLAPAMTLSTEEVYVKAKDEQTVLSETLTIGNEGEYKLSYTLALDPSGVGEQEEENEGGGIAPWSKAIAANTKAKAEDLAAAIMSAKPLATSTNAYDTPQDFKYNNALFYPAMPGNTAAYNFGSGTLYDKYIAATSFTAPEGGFNMSHLYLPVTLASTSETTTIMASNYNVDIKVVQGSDPTGETVLGHGKLFIASQNTVAGKFYVVPLDRSVYLNPGEEFCVVVTYDAGVMYPAYLSAKEEAYVPNRYMAYSESTDWYDIAAAFEDQYGSLGFIMTPLETVPGQPWISLVETAGESEIAPGETAQVTFSVNPAAARMEKGNKAVLVIKSNDPQRPTVNVPVYLDLNGSPVIEGPESTVYAKEGAKTSVELTVYDPDMDDYTILFQDGTALAKLVSVEPAATDAATVTEGEDGTYAIAGATEPVTLTVEIAPDYGQASKDNAFVVTAEDKAGKAAEFTVRYEVEHVNRAPEAVEHADVEVPVGGTSTVVSFAELFSDPDGDELTYSFAPMTGTVAEAYTTPTGVIFFGKTEGTAEATVTATDPDGLSAVAKVPVKVLDMSGIESVDASSSKLTVMPNPVEDVLHAVCGFDADNTVFTLYDASGKAVATATADVYAGTTVDIDTAHLPAGHYILVAAWSDGGVTARVIKR